MNVKGDAIFIDGQRGREPLNMETFRTLKGGLLLNFEQAVELANEFLAEEAKKPGVPLVLDNEYQAQAEGKFYFGCQSAAYIKSRQLSDMIIGTGCVCVDGETGTVRLLGAVESAELGLFGD
ncbi:MULTISPECIES: hypothetical protein [Streptomyces]|uniref:Uncharacterized protein n=1 Tax=Streptomyces nondiastaticus TaxID=3154512 RepID=A0ABW6U3E5_9ACTN|nr:hypothetical protein [Streptomyces sp. VNUA116]WKU42692.1 hypothetical protein Q3V23_00620 [Streptomyces sp. VNUA116]